MKYLWLAFFLVACSTTPDPMCHPEVAQDYLVAVPMLPLCVIKVAEQQGGGTIGAVGPSEYDGGHYATFSAIGPNGGYSFGSVSY